MYPVTETKSPRKIFVLFAGGLLVLLFILYAPALKHYFTSDDYVLLNLFASEPFAYFARDFLHPPPNRFRPLLLLIGKIQYTFMGLNPILWNLSKLLGHWVNALLIFFIVRTLTKNLWVAALASLFFAIHFIQPEVAIGVLARDDNLLTMLVTGSILFYLGYRQKQRRWLLVLSLLLMLAALFCKESAIMILPVLIAIEFLSTEPGSRRSKLQALLPFGLVAFGYLIIRLPAIYSQPADSLYRPALGWHIVKNYLFLLVASIADLDHRSLLEKWNQFVGSGNPKELIQSFISRPLVLALCLAVPLIYLTAALRGPRPVKLMFWWAILFLGPAALLRGTGERILYLPLAGLVSIQATFIYYLFQGTLTRNGLHRIFAAGLVIAVLALWSGYNFSRSFSRVQNWKKAGNYCKSVIDTIDQLSSGWEINTQVFILNLPDNFHGAWVFRNGFPELKSLFFKWRQFEMHKVGDQVTPDQILSTALLGLPLRVLQATETGLQDVTEIYLTGQSAFQRSDQKSGPGTIQK